MRPLPVNSSDFEVARYLSRRLAHPGSEKAVGEAPAASTSYLRFAPPVVARPPSRTSSSSAEAVRDIATVPLEMDSWEVFLAWSLEISRARAGFVVDSQGFVIASRGNVPSGDFTGTGAELCFAMEQLASIDHASGTLQSVELQFEGYKLIGIRAVTPDPATSFILGFVGSRSLGDDLRRTIVRQLAYSLPTLR